MIYVQAASTHRGSHYDAQRQTFFSSLLSSMVWSDVQVGASGKPIALDKEGFPIVDDLDLAQEASTSHLDQLQVRIMLVQNTFSQTCVEGIDCICICLQCN